MAELFVAGHGVVETECLPIHRAVKEYDERLSFKRNDRDGAYCLFVKLPRPHNEWNPPEKPLIGWQSIPDKEDVLAWIYRADTHRHGDKILQQIDEHNEMLRDFYRQKADEASSNAAEHLEFILRKHGKSPVIKSTRPTFRG